MKIICLMVLSLLVSGAVGAVNETCKSCSWIHSSTKPSLGLAFLKTRKSGSTNFDAIVSDWLMEIQCSPFNYVHIIERGIIDGMLDFGNFEGRVTCPFINFKTMESTCWDIEKLNALPPRGRRNGVPLHLFTVLREPLQRIGSQAFYSRDVVGTKTIVQFVVDRCFRHLNMKGSDVSIMKTTYDLYVHCKEMKLAEGPSKCSCVFEAQRLAMVELKSNETLWFDWFEHSHRQVFYFTNLYKKNYYLERMFGGNSLLYNEYYNTTFHAALRCLYRGCDEGAANLNVLHELSAMTSCVNNIHPTKINDRILPMAKQLLRSHIDFIIMEKYGEYSTAGAIASVLGADQRDIARISAVKHDGRSQLASISSYRDIMPPSVVKYLEAENAWDIEFYHYAIEVFEERAAAEGWNRG